jgi:hypothetical protein
LLTVIQAPSVVLADFDYAFFDLKADDDIYPDNPQQYIIRNDPGMVPDQGGRYPPELYQCYEGHNGDSGSERMTSKTDVWAIGQMMWNLVMNLPGKEGFRQQPFFFFQNEEENIHQHLNNGQLYDTIAHRDALFSGRTPYDASDQYSTTLKDAIVECLHYRQHDRISFAKLERTTSLYADGTRVPPDSNVLGDVVIKVPEAIEGLRVGQTFDATARKTRPTAVPDNIINLISP